MSTKLSFKEALERPGATEDDRPAKSASRTVSMALAAPDHIGRPVDFIRLLNECGISLKRARMTLDRLAERHLIAVDIDADCVDRVVKQASRLGVIAVPLENPQVDPKTIRDKQGLSQPEFACLYGLEVETLKNWEQGRNVPDGPTRVLLGIIDRCPHVVLEARAKSKPGTRWPDNIFATTKESR
jgi:DNA-binding transcriptional regulator YiaG